MRRSYRKQLTIWKGQATLAALLLERMLARWFRLGKLHQQRVARMVRASSLFDDRWYLEVNSDVAASGVDPLVHYVRYGDREGRQPMPLFDPIYYRAHSRHCDLRHNSLLHYVLLGRYLKVPASAWFDVEFYLRQNRDVARSGKDPLLHYLQYGALEGRSPCRHFDGAYYLRNNPDVQRARVNPLIHYLNSGRIEGRVVMPSGDESTEPVTDFQVVLAHESWDDVSPRKPVAHEDVRVDIIVPVYKGLNETLRCLRSVLLSSIRIPYELIVIDDASPEAELVDELRKYAGQNYFTLLQNTSNQGFVSSCNRGMALHPDRDVVLLNSDTEVYADWLDRLQMAAYRGERVGTVTPLSNNATIASYPRFIHDNPYPLEISFAQLDELAARTNTGLVVDAPTGVGFCMYLRRDCLDETGLFDEESFGRGYGEENDLCQRAIGKRWRNVIAADVFVHHLGSVSFLGERASRVANAMRMMDRLHPSYQRDIRRFIHEDPLARARRNLDWARLARNAAAENVLLVCHSRGGGAERHLREEAQRLQAAGVGVFYMRPVSGSTQYVRIAESVGIHLPNLEHFQLGDLEALAQALRELRITRIQVHGIVDFDLQAPDALIGMARSIGAKLEVMVHDYQAICPRINLADENGRYCGEPDESGCAQCLVTRGNRYGLRAVRPWRESNARLFHAADQLLVPDQDVSERLARYFPELEFTVVPHQELLMESVRISRPVLDADEPLHVVVLGAIGKVKGYDVLLECARHAKERGLPLRFSVMGYSMDDRRLEQAGICVTGRYLEEEGADKLKAMKPHVVWLPSLWPETYSYTLSMALSGGYPVCAFDMGAIGRRLHELGLDEHLLPWDASQDVPGITRYLLEMRERWLPASCSSVA